MRMYIMLYNKYDSGIRAIQNVLQIIRFCFDRTIYQLDSFVHVCNVGHFVVVCGFNRKKKVIYYKDPGSNCGKECILLRFIWT